MSVRQQRWDYQQAADLRQRLVEQLALLDEHGAEHLHPKEVDARVMQCNGRRFFAYNAQAVVDHESDLIVALGLSADENDLAQLVPMMEETKRVLGAVAKMTDVDTGYASGEQLHQAHQRHLPILVPLQAESDKGLLPKSSFAYDRERDAYVCPRGERLTLVGHNKKSRDASYERAIYRCHTRDCPERAACSDDPKGRAVSRTPFDDDLARQRALMAKPEMRNLYELRKEIVEHIFGCIKGNDGFRRFTVRGFAKVLAQWALACTVFNLRKLHQAWTDRNFAWGAPAYA